MKLSKIKLYSPEIKLQMYLSCKRKKHQRYRVVNCGGSSEHSSLDLYKSLLQVLTRSRCIVSLGKYSLLREVKCN